MSTLTLDEPMVSAEDGGGRRPPRPPVAAANAAASGPRESATVLKRSFSPMPARLSPVKRGEVRVPRPKALVGTGDLGFAFHPTDPDLAPMGARDQLYAYTAPASAGELILAVDREGHATVGICVAIDEASLQIQCGTALKALPADAIAETAIIVMIEMQP